ncbi:MAG: preprotein translocase subunit SecG [Candidatus Eisenbacteria bacterium]
MVFVVVLILHIVISLLLMGSVLLQSGRGGALSASFGGGGNQTLFGGRGATSFLTKATWILGSAFFLTSLVLALTVGKQQSSSAPRSLLRENPVEAPASPGAGGSGLPISPGGTEAIPSPSGTAPTPAPAAPASPEGGTQGQ